MLVSSNNVVVFLFVARNYVFCYLLWLHLFFSPVFTDESWILLPDVSVTYNWIGRSELDSPKTIISASSLPNRLCLTVMWVCHLSSLLFINTTFAHQICALDTYHVTGWIEMFFLFFCIFMKDPRFHDKETINWRWNWTGLKRQSNVFLNDCVKTTEKGIRWCFLCLHQR